MRRSLLASALIAGTLLVPAAAASASTDIVISEFRVRGPAGGNDEFIELRNTASSPVTIGGWEVRGSNASGTTSVRATITSGTVLQPGGIYLLTNSNGYSGSVAGDQTYGTGITDDGGIGIFRPGGSSADEVGMSSGSAYREATPLANLGTSNQNRSYERKNKTQDTDVNAADFVVITPSDPQNSGAGPQEPVEEGLEISDIQGAAHTSPYNGKLVGAVQGVVTARSGNGFWMQDPTPDADPATSEGIFVFRGGSPEVGSAVAVDGRVTEFRPGNDANNLTTTEITASKVTTTGTGEIAPTLIGPGGLEPPTEVIEDDVTGDAETTGEFDPAEDGLDFHESLEGMLVEIAEPRATGPTNSFGEVSVVPEGLGGPFTPRGGIIITADDFNPERLILDDVIADTPDVNAGDGLEGPVEAVVDYSFGNFKYLVTSTPERIDNGLQREVTDAPRANQLAISSMNVENLDALDSQDKFDELASIVVNNLRSPDILAVEEIQDNDGPANTPSTNADATYRRFIQAIADQGGASYEFRQIDPNANTDGGEPGGNIRVGFLFRTDRGLQFVDRPGATANTANSVVATRKGAALKYSPGRIEPTDPAFDDSRKPLAAEFLWKGRTVFAIANHFNSKGGDQPLFGRNQPPRRSSEVQRHQQAGIVAGFVEKILAADPRAAIAVMGDFNDFQFSETLGILEGAGLANLMETLPENEQYSYVFDGNGQTLDQILVSHELLTPGPEYDSVHVNAEFFDQASDHDPQVARVVVRGTGNANGQ